MFSCFEVIYKVVTKTNIISEDLTTLVMSDPLQILKDLNLSQSISTI